MYGQIFARDERRFVENGADYSCAVIALAHLHAGERWALRSRLEEALSAYGVRKFKTRGDV